MVSTNATVVGRPRSSSEQDRDEETVVSNSTSEMNALLAPGTYKICLCERRLFGTSICTAANQLAHRWTAGRLTVHGNVFNLEEAEAASPWYVSVGFTLAWKRKARVRCVAYERGERFFEGWSGGSFAEGLALAELVADLGASNRTCGDYEQGCNERVFDGGAVESSQGDGGRGAVRSKHVLHVRVFAGREGSSSSREVQVYCDDLDRGNFLRSTVLATKSANRLYSSNKHP